MLKRFIYLLIPSCLLLASCSQNNASHHLKNNIDAIKRLQEKTKNNKSDSILMHLNQADKIIQEHGNIPDSIVLEHMFLKGLYFYDTKKLDSAAYYFHNTVNRVDLSSISPREITYFRKTLVADLELESSLPNGISTAEKFIDALLRIEDYENLAHAYNFLERANRFIGDYEKALHYNKKTKEAATLSGNKNISAITYVARSNLLYSLNRKEEAYKILDSISKDQNKYSNDVNRQLFNCTAFLNYFDSNFENAIVNYKKALSFLRKETTHPEYYYLLVESHINLSEAYIEIGEYDISEVYLDSARANLKKDFRIDNLIFLGEQTLRLNYLTKKNIDNILSDYDALVKIQNDFYKKKIDDELLALKLEYEKGEALAAQNRENEKRNERLKIGLTIVLLITPLIIIIVYLLYRQRPLSI